MSVDLKDILLQCTRSAIPGPCDFERSVGVFATTWGCFTVFSGS